MDKMYVDLLHDSTPLLTVIAGIVTITAVLLGCVYSRQKSSKRADKYKVTEDKKDEGVQRLEGDGEEEEETVGEEQGVSGKWPVDDKSANSKPTPDIMRDPIEFCSHIPSEVRKTQQRIAMEEAEKAMDEEQKQREREIQREQLAAIFKMMEEQKDKFGVDNMDDINDQMKLYTVS